MESDFAKKLKRMRERAKLTGYALAKRAGLPHQTISKLERGEREPGWNIVQLLRIALGCRFEDLADTSIVLPGEVQKRSEQPQPTRVRVRVIPPDPTPIRAHVRNITKEVRQR